METRAHHRPSVALARLSSVDVCAAFGFGGEFVQGYLDSVRP